MWSPPWKFTDAQFERSAVSFDNPDFVDVVIHSYRHRYGLVPGDPAMVIAGMDALSRNGLRYPIPQYGVNNDVRAGMGVSYGER